MKIVLLGNGFDLSHGLETSYNHFVKYMFNNHLDYKEDFSQFFNLRDRENISYENLKHNNFRMCTFRNNLLKGIVTKISSNLWCDIESLYFHGLMDAELDSEKYDKEFEGIKNEFIKYLRNLNTEKVPELKAYKLLFSRFDDYVILNFNYTSTIRKYVDPNTIVIDIHGQLSDANEHIIFGYNATNEETESLRRFNDPYLVKNLKRYNYRNSDKEDYFKTILNDLDENHEVWIVGHSCGFSDRLLLKQIFEAKNVDIIRVFYFNDQHDLRNKIVQIENISETDIVFPKIKNRKETLKMPQKGSDPEDIELVNDFINLRFEN